MSHPTVTPARPRPAPKAALFLLGTAVTATLVGCAGSAGHTPVAPPIDHPATAGMLTATDVDAWLDGLLPAALEGSDIAGATVSVIHEGQMVTARGYGHADTGTGDGAAGPVAVDPEQTLFRAGSVSKLVTATAVLQLVERGDLDLDADIDQYLDFDLPRRYDADITARHLLTHTAGFEERIAGMISFGEAPAELREVLATDPPAQVYPPGGTPAYSNYGNALGGYLVERITGMPFEEYVERHIFDPAAMASSTFRQPLPDDLAARMSNGYPSSAEPAESFEIVNVPPAGSLTTSATDMAQFMLAHVGHDATVLDEETLELMHAPGLDADSLGSLADGRRMTLGFFDESRNGHRILGHGGDTLYFHSHLQIYPDAEAGIFVSLNSAGESAADSLVLRQSILAGFADRYFPATTDSAAAPVDQQTMAANAAAAAGTYTSARGFHTTFLSLIGLVDRTQVTALDDGRLLFEPGPGTVSPARYEQISPTVWREVGGHREIAMRVADDQVTAIGHDSALTLVPVGPARQAAGPIIAGSAAVLLITVLAWPAGALWRRFVLRQPADRRGRLPRTLSRVAATAALLALAGWAVCFVAAMNFQEVPAGAIRGAQALQWVGAAGLIPAVLRSVNDLRFRSGWFRFAAGILVLLGLAGTAWFAVEFPLLVTSISY